MKEIFGDCISQSRPHSKFVVGSFKNIKETTTAAACSLRRAEHTHPFSIASLRSAVCIFSHSSTPGAGSVSVMKKRYLNRKEKKRKDLFFKHTHLQARARCARDPFF